MSESISNSHQCLQTLECSAAFAKTTNILLDQASRFSFLECQDKLTEM
jgi:hypothetical protein